MTETYTPECDYGSIAQNFELKGVDGNIHTLASCKGPKATLIIFMCNHCPYVKSILDQLIVEVSVMQKKGIGCVAINSNDFNAYPEDSYDNMQDIAKKNGFSFPYLIDETQDIAKLYGSVCTPDFFGFNSNLELQYRGRFDDRKTSKQMSANSSDLFKGMIEIARTGMGPAKQIPSVGCSIKWR